MNLVLYGDLPLSPGTPMSWFWRKQQLRKYSEDQPRDDAGRWTAGGGMESEFTGIGPSVNPRADALDALPTGYRIKNGNTVWEKGRGDKWTADGSRFLNSRELIREVGPAAVTPHILELEHGSYEGLIARVSQPDGGFTYNPTTSNEPRTGYALSVYPDRSKSFSADSLTLQDLAEYTANNADLLSNAENHIGAWHDPASGRVFLDVSRVVSDEAAAATLARDHDQIAYFDLGRGASVTVNPNATSGGAAIPDESVP